MTTVILTLKGPNNAGDGPAPALGFQILPNAKTDGLILCYKHDSYKNGPKIFQSGSLNNPPDRQIEHFQLWL